MDAQQTPKSTKKRKNLNMAYMVRMIFLAWKSFARQVRYDRQLFFKLRDFIVRRLTKKAMLGLKIHYVKSFMSKQFVIKRNIRIKK